MIKNLQFPYDIVKVESDELKLAKAADFFGAVSSSDFANFVECGRTNVGDEVIFIEIEPEVGNKPVNDIQYREQIAVQFSAKDEVVPYVFALRDDFPLVSHLNLMPFEKPRSLCLYERPYEELKFNWRGIVFLERIREWLSLTAKGELHQSDQPLEPFFLSTAGSLILDENPEPSKPLSVYRLFFDGKKISLIAFSQPKNGWEQFEHKVVCLVFRTPPHVHGVITTTPTNLQELNDALDFEGFQLIEKELKGALENYISRTQFHEYQLAFVIVTPKVRSDGGEIESYESFTFLTVDKVKEVCKAINLWDEAGGFLAARIPKVSYEPSSAAKVALLPFNTYFSLNSSSAQKVSALSPEACDVHVTQIGSGAIGSQVFLNLKRSGFGKWTVIDDDLLFSHNLTKHALLKEHLGFSKSKSIVEIGNSLLPDSPSKAIHDNFLKPSNDEQIRQSLAQAELIIDTSASLPVARKLAALRLSGRTVSIFLNPSGTDLVILSEAKEKRVSVDDLEMQYYRMLLRLPSLHNHLESPGNVRYSNSCRDITSTISQDNVAVFSGVASKTVKALVTNDVNEIFVWRLNDDGSINKYSQDVFDTRATTVNGWSLHIDLSVIQALHEARAKKLPNETGGILIGSHDLGRKIIYIVDTILSPTDSAEYPTSYYRGISGVTSRLVDIDKITGGNLTYVGEWHSHPERCSLAMSDDDKILFNWISNHMKQVGLPPLMVICGKEDLAMYV